MNCYQIFTLPFILFSVALLGASYEITFRPIGQYVFNLKQDKNCGQPQAR